jgi:hypothetical protein
MNGKIMAIEFYPEMRINVRFADREECNNYTEHMKKHFNTTVGIFCSFCVNDDLVYGKINRSIFNINNEIDKELIKGIQLILQRRMVNDNGSKGTVSLFINNEEYKPPKRFIHSIPNSRYIALELEIGLAKRKKERNWFRCLKLSNDSIDNINNLIKNNNMRNLSDLKGKKYINFNGGANDKTAKRAFTERKLFDKDNGWFLNEKDIDWKPEIVEVKEGYYRTTTIRLRFCVAESPKDLTEQNQGYFKNFSCGKGCCAGIYLYFNDILINLEGDRELPNLQSSANYRFRMSDGWKNCIPIVEIEETNIKIRDSQLFECKTIKAGKINWKRTRLCKALLPFIGKFIRHHMYYIDEEYWNKKKKKNEKKKEEEEKEEEEEEWEEASDAIEEMEQVADAIQQTIQSNHEEFQNDEESEEETSEEDEYEYEEKKEELQEETSEELEEENNEKLVQEKKEKREGSKKISLIVGNKKIEKSDEEKEEAKKRSKRVSTGMKNTIAARQQFRCNNSPDGPIFGNGWDGFNNYKCPMWRIPEQRGRFDDSSYEIDHIIEKNSNNGKKMFNVNDNKNLQALCPCCHNFKTRAFMVNSNR